LTLDSKANAAHLGRIYNYDEDDNTNIFIPYLYMGSASRNLNSIDINMDRTFKGNTAESFTLVPINDSFSTPLCECQREMLLEKIQQNLVKRTAVLSEIAKNIIFQMNDVIQQNSQIKKWSNKKTDPTHLQNLQKQLSLKIVECQTFVQKIEKLNSDIKDNESQLAVKQQEGQKKQSDIELSEYYLKVYRTQFWNFQNINDATSYGPKESQEAASQVNQFVHASAQDCEAAQKNTVSLYEMFPREKLSSGQDGYKRWAQELTDLQKELKHIRREVTLSNVLDKTAAQVTKISTLKGKFDAIFAEKRK